MDEINKAARAGMHDQAHPDPQQPEQEVLPEIVELKAQFQELEKAIEDAKAEFGGLTAYFDQPRPSQNQELLARYANAFANPLGFDYEAAFNAESEKDFLELSSHVIWLLHEQKKDLVDHQLSTNSDLFKVRKDLRDIQDQIRTMEQLKGWRSLLKKHGYAAAQKQQDVLLNKESGLSSELYHISEKSGAINHKQSQIESLQKKKLLKSLEAIAKEAKVKQIHFFETLKASEVLKTEIQENYVQQKILPYLDTLVDRNFLTEDQKATFVNRLRSLLTQQLSPQEANQFSILQADFLHEHSFEVQRLWHFVRPLLTSDYQTVLHQVFGDYAMVQLFSIGHVTTDPLEVGFHYENKNKTTRQIARSNNSDADIDFTDLNISNSSINMDFWHAIRSSEQLQAVAGQFIKDEDDEIYRQLLLSPKGVQWAEIEKMVHYPTPEVIRLLILCSSSGLINHETRGKSNAALYSLVHSPDWPAISQNALTMVPAEVLSQAQAAMREANPNRLSDANGAENVSLLAFKILSNKDPVQTELSGYLLKELALKNLTHDQLLSHLVENEALSSEEVQSLQQAIEVLNGLGGLFEDERITQYDAYSYNFISQIRNEALDLSLLMIREPESDKVQAAQKIRNLVLLAAEIKNFPSNISKLIYFGSSQVVEKAKTSPPDELTLLFSLHEDFPFLAQIDLSQPENHNSSHEVTNVLVESWQLTKDLEGKVFINTLVKRYTELDPKNLSKALIIIKLVVEGKISQKFALEIPDQYPLLLKTKSLSLAQAYQKRYFSSESAIVLFNQFIKTYEFDTNTYSYDNLNKLINLAQQEILTHEQLIKIEPFIAEFQTKNSHLFSFLLEYSRYILVSDEAQATFRKLEAVYGPKEVKDTVEELKFVYDQLKDENLTVENAFEFPQAAPLLMTTEKKNIRRFIFENYKVLVAVPEDVAFYNKMVGLYGNAAEQIIKDYKVCLERGSLTLNDKELVLEILSRIRVLSPNIIEGYKEAKRQGKVEQFIAMLRSLGEKMTGAGKFTAEERSSSYYQDVRKATYSNNAGGWASYESSDSCTDRTSDLIDGGFVIRPRYEIYLLSGAKVQLKKDMVAQPEVAQRYQSQLLETVSELNQAHFDPEVSKQRLESQIDEVLIKMDDAGELDTLVLSDLNTVEEKLFVLMTEVIYGKSKVVSIEELKKIVVLFQFSYHEDVRDYIAGTIERASYASDENYALCCELYAFFSDQIKEVYRNVVTEAMKNPAVANQLQNHFDDTAYNARAARIEQERSKLRIDTLGLSDSFVKQIMNTLNKRKNLRPGEVGRQYDEVQTRRLIHLYEQMADFTEAEKSASTRGETRGIYGQLKNQRQKTEAAIAALSGQDLSIYNVHLGEINFGQLLEETRQIEIGEYSEAEFTAFTTQQLVDIFSKEVRELEQEIDKYKSESGKIRRKLNAYIDKGHTADARMVGGVCVSGDNPDKAKLNQWDMPNYFQLVFQDPESLRCQGLVLLHHFTDQNGKRILTASLNPAQTYVLSSDEKALFEGIMSTLEDFASDNNFDMICFSQNKAIRTNRTGGLFESAMDARVAAVSKQYSFEEPQKFSYKPSYSIKDMDIAWERTT